MEEGPTQFNNTNLGHFGKIPAGTKYVKKRDWKGQNAGWYIQEKIDGSQLTFCVPVKGKPRFFNRGKEKVAPYPTVFLRTVTALTNHLTSLYVDSDLIFHGEAVGSPKHNVTVYERVPRFAYVLFGVQRGATYLGLTEARKIARRYGLEFAAVIYENSDDNVHPADKIAEIMNPEQGQLDSFLGGKAEGIVLKHPTYVNRKGKTSVSKFKFVYPQFKEVHRKKQAKHAQTPDEFLSDLVSWFHTEAWMRKAAFRLRDNEQIDLACTDIKQRKRDGKRVQREMARDIREECETLLREELWQFLGPWIIQRVVEGAHLEYADGFIE